MERLPDELRRLGERERARAVDRGEAAYAYAAEPANRRTEGLAQLCAEIAAHKGDLAIALLAAADRLEAVERIVEDLEANPLETTPEGTPQINRMLFEERKLEGLRIAERLREALGMEV